MTDSTTLPFSRDVLLEHRAWVRALAGSLVRDEHAADDLTQDTMVRALQSMPAATRSPRAWLGTVLRNRTRDEARKRTRRGAREEAVARSDTHASAADLAAQAEIHRHVLDAVLQLAAPFRDVVLMRFFEGLPPADIASRLGIPAATVRTRLHRALGRLRERFDADRGGDDRAWRAALLPLLDGPDAVETTGATPAQARPGSLVAVGVGLVLCAAVAIGLVLGASGTRTDGARPAEVAGETSDPAAGAHDVGGTTGRTRERVDPAARRRSGNAPGADVAGTDAGTSPDAAAGADDDARVLRVDVRLPDGSPAAGVGVVLLDGDGFSKTGGGRVLARATTDDTGVASFRNAPEAEVRVVARSSGVAAVGAVVDLYERVPKEPVRLELAAAAMLRGTVLAGDGAAVAGARLSLVLTGDWFGPVGTTTSDDAGHFAFDSLPPAVFASPANIEVTAAGFVLRNHQVPAEVCAVEQRIELERAIVLRGRVIDAEGHPVAGADVTSPTAPRYAVTEDDGRFALGGIQVDKSEEPETFVVVQSEEHAWKRVDVSADAIAAGDLGEIVVDPGTPLHGRVVDVAGRAVPGAFVWVQGRHVRQIVGNLVCNDKGRFELPHASVESYLIHATAPADDAFSGASGEIDGIRVGDTDVTVVVSFARTILVEFVGADSGQPVRLTNCLVYIDALGFEAEQIGGGFSDEDGMTSVRIRADVAGPYKMTVRDFEGWDDTVLDRVEVRDDAEVRVTARMRRTR